MFFICVKETTMRLRYTLHIEDETYVGRFKTVHSTTFFLDKLRQSHKESLVSVRIEDCETGLVLFWTPENTPKEPLYDETQTW